MIVFGDPGPTGFVAIEADGATSTIADATPRAPTDLYAVLFTSGSTGSPKGAMRTYATFFAMVASYQIGHSPRSFGTGSPNFRRSQRISSMRMTHSTSE